MKIKLLAFGIAKEIIGCSAMEMTLGEKESITLLKTKIASQFPDFQKIANYRLAVNMEYQNDDFEISDGDEVAIIPPVSGG